MQCLTDLFLLLVAVELICKNPQPVGCMVTFGNLSNRITQLSNSYRHVRFKIFEHLIARGYNLFQR